MEILRLTFPVRELNDRKELSNNFSRESVSNRFFYNWCWLRSFVVSRTFYLSDKGAVETEW